MPVKWMLASSTTRLDAARYLGERRELPQAGEPGQWCDVLVRDGDGDQRWRVVAVDAQVRREAPTRS